MDPSATPQATAPAPLRHTAASSAFRRPAHRATGRHRRHAPADRHCHLHGGYAIAHPSTCSISPSNAMHFVVESAQLRSAFSTARNCSSAPIGSPCINRRTPSRSRAALECADRRDVVPATAGQSTMKRKPRSAAVPSGNVGDEAPLLVINRDASCWGDDTARYAGQLAEKRLPDAAATVAEAAARAAPGQSNPFAKITSFRSSSNAPMSGPAPITRG